MNNLNLKEIVENLIDTFIHAGKISLDHLKKPCQDPEGIQ